MGRIRLVRLRRVHVAAVVAGRVGGGRRRRIARRRLEAADPRVVGGVRGPLQLDGRGTTSAATDRGLCALLRHAAVVERGAVGEPGRAQHLAGEQDQE